MTTKTDITLPHEFRSANDIPVERATIKRERMIEIIAEAVEADRQNHIADVRKMVPSDEELIKWGGEEEFFLFCSQDEFLDIVKSALSRYGGGQPAIFGQAETRMNAGSAARNGGDLGQAVASAEPDQELTRSSRSDPCPHCGAGPYYYCAHPFRDAPVAQEPVAWVSKTIAYSKYISDARYRKLRPAAQRWYEPYKCASCAAPVAAQVQPTGYEEAGSFIWDGDEWRMAAAKYGEDPDVVTLYKRVNAQDEPQQSGISGELPTAQDREDAAYQRDVAIGMLAHWVVAIEKNGTGWDDWDEHFKNARFRDTPIRKLLDEAIDAARAAKGE